MTEVRPVLSCSRCPVPQQPEGVSRQQTDFFIKRFAPRCSGMLIPLEQRKLDALSLLMPLVQLLSLIFVPKRFVYLI